ncbi:MAG: NADH-quinone oxidoreductase subunit L, partial [Planctomycetota bacterium]
AHTNAAALHATEEQAHSAALEFGLMGLSLSVVFISMVAAFFIYRKGMARAAVMAQSMSGLHRVVYNKFFVDEFYLKYIVGSLKGLANFSSRFDLRVIDGLVNLVARIVEVFGFIVRVTQTGIVHTYSFWFILGAVAVVWYILGH